MCVARRRGPHLQRSLDSEAVAQLEADLYQRKVGAALRANAARTETIFRLVGTCLDHALIDNREGDVDRGALFNR